MGNSSLYRLRWISNENIVNIVISIFLAGEIIINVKILYLWFLLP